MQSSVSSMWEFLKHAVYGIQNCVRGRTKFDGVVFDENMAKTLILGIMVNVNEDIMHGF